MITLLVKPANSVMETGEIARLSGLANVILFGEF